MPVDAAHAGSTGQDISSLAWVVPLSVGAVAVLGTTKLLAGPLVLPALSITLLTAGFVLASAVWLSGRRRQGAWYVAGGLVLLGFAAGLLSDGHEALIELDRLAGTTGA